MRVLLTDGSSLTSRQTALLLARAGHRVGVLASTPVGLTRFTRATSAWHRVPRVATDPHRWLAAALSRYQRGRYEVLLPTQEQVAVLSWAADQGLLADVRTVVPPWTSFSQVFDKISAHRTLQAHRLPQPATVRVRRLAGLVTWDRFPVYLKLPLGTATAGVIRVSDAQGLATAVAKLTASGAFAEGAPGVLVQDEVPGALVMAQALFDHGRLVAAHGCERLAEGVGGAASRKLAVDVAPITPMLERLGEALDWHGPLAADLVMSPDGPVIIDVNPRLVEPVNAALSGLDLPQLMIELALRETPSAVPASRPGVRTHQGLMAVMAAASRGRLAVLRELLAVRSSSGAFGDSVEELTPSDGDWRARIPLIGVGLAALARPRSVLRLAADAVGHYSMSPESWRSLTDPS